MLKPLFMWAGGKTKMLPQYREHEDGTHSAVKAKEVLIHNGDI